MNDKVAGWACHVVATESCCSAGPKADERLKTEGMSTERSRPAQTHVEDEVKVSCALEGTSMPPPSVELAKAWSS